jgi:hypothetical protein
MKRLFAPVALLVVSAALLAQQGPPKSPPATSSATIGGKNITITYSSPRVRGREGKIFTKDGLISKDPHYPVWRAGANAATKLHTDGSLLLGSEKAAVPAGDYTLFVDISDPDHWVLIVSKQVGEWGLAYDKSQDLVHVKMHMAKPEAAVEELKYTLRTVGGNTGSLSLAWEDHVGVVSIAVQ